MGTIWSIGENVFLSRERLCSKDDFACEDSKERIESLRLLLKWMGFGNELNSFAPAAISKSYRLTFNGQHSHQIT